MLFYHFYNFRVVKRLISHYKCNGIEIKSGKRDGITPIHIAAQNGNIEVVKTLLTAYPNQIDCADNKGQTPLHYAAQHCRNHSEVVTELIKR